MHMVLRTYTFQKVFFLLINSKIREKKNVPRQSSP